MNTSGINNTAIGSHALYTNSTGHHNTAIGDSSLYSNVKGHGNTALGTAADVTSDSLTNATAVGFRAKVDDSKKVRVGNGEVTVIEGEVAFSASSDRRLKEDITPVQVGLDFIRELNPVQYHRISNKKDDLEMGLVAQELLVILQKYGIQSGMVNQGGDQMMSVRYNDLLAPLIKAVQEQQAIIEGQAQSEKAQKERIDELEARLDAMEALLAGSR